MVSPFLIYFPDLSLYHPPFLTSHFSFFPLCHEQAPSAALFEELEMDIGGECMRHAGGVIDAKCDLGPATPPESSEDASMLQLHVDHGGPGPPGSLRVWLKSEEQAVACRDLLHGRWFDQRMLQASVEGRNDNPPPPPPPPAVTSEDTAPPSNTPMSNYSVASAPTPAAAVDSGASSSAAAPPPPPPSSISTEEDKLTRALKALEVRLKLNPSDKDLHANKSGVLGLMHQWQAAAASAAIACDLDEGQVEAGECGETWGWGLYRRAEACLALKDWLGAARAAKAAYARVKTVALAAESGEGDTGGSGTTPTKKASATAVKSVPKFAALAGKCVNAARLNLEPLDLITLDMEMAAEADLKDSNAKEKERDKEFKGKKVELDDDQSIDLGFTYNPAAHCYICKQRGHTKVRLTGKSRESAREEI